MGSTSPSTSFPHPPISLSPTTLSATSSLPSYSPNLLMRTTHLPPGHLSSSRTFPSPPPHLHSPPPILPMTQAPVSSPMAPMPWSPPINTPQFCAQERGDNSKEKSPGKKKEIRKERRERKKERERERGRKGRETQDRLVPSHFPSCLDPLCCKGLILGLRQVTSMVGHRGDKPVFPFQLYFWTTYVAVTISPFIFGFWSLNLN